ncbi:MAG TPA: PIN domain-containing protein [Tepidisphaeraceae bacterium]|nr:PIN domain-containing protein [Tepidisphaeraceae bacterium]
MVLVDTNVLLRLIQIGHPHQKPALDAIAYLRLQEQEQLGTCTQALYEMYVVCTRPNSAPNPGLGLTPLDALTQIETAQNQFPPQPEPRGLLTRWKDLVRSCNVVGKAAHDARIAALMMEQEIEKLLTFNDSDFVRFPDIQVLNPFDVLGIARF